MRAIIIRQKQFCNQTLGTLELFDPSGKSVFSCKTLELPWLENQRQKSCIPKGTYKVTVRSSLKFGSHFYVTNVPNRDLILIHHGNYNTDILGCILVGVAFADINGDNILDITSSRQTMQKLLKIAPNGFELEIR